MDKLCAAAAGVTDRFVRSRPVLWLRSVLDPVRVSGNAQRGQGLAEYALILAGIAIVTIVSLGFLGITINGLLQAPINAGFTQVLSQIGI